jgi:sialic acid synthase SpsE
MEIKIGDRLIGLNHPTYFIADIAANHDGSLERARMLIRLAKEAGADAAKFQNFRAPKIVSDYGFRSLGRQVSHQASWKKSVFQVYQEASIPFDWTPILKEECEKVGIHYFTSPYDFEAIDYVEPYVPAYKIGSGDIDWIEALERMAKKGKPVILATGAATIADVQRAVHAILKHNPQLVLMQCNTNYTASPENYDHLHLNVLRTYATMFPNVILGLSDHTQSPAPIVAAVTLGARVIERHFTDDNNREGPDHKFALNPEAWAKMVEEVRIAGTFARARPISLSLATNRIRDRPAALSASGARHPGRRSLHPRDDRRAAPGDARRDQAARDPQRDWHESVDGFAQRQGTALDGPGKLTAP